ncbi:methyltransferase domain-containing protein [Panacibacter sp. DH6]|uniref:Methyltransferase domain-containing protein n=1 Tax=Panacibacter microcysteis TaxID=2793269 RepID=A0A931GYZ0_9BACT|nr:class I SAM-dependent methyltransferase [Panacibacter microcysteis]MBG9377928.1 methyltransferase domain-containing protein [Panacibacter microcysteis]
MFSSIKRALHPKILQKKMLRIAMRGKNVECPCCGATFVTFLPAGIQKRPNAACLKCGSLERHRALSLYFKDNPGLFKAHNRLLHVAPEKIFSIYFQSRKDIEYVAIDLEPDAYDYAPATIAMDLTDLQFDADNFDIIICSHVLEHVPDDAKAMQEMYRVLKPGGWAIINVPVDPNRTKTFEDPTIHDPVKRTELFNQPDHVRVYGKDYVDRLQAAGFVVEVIQWYYQYDHNTRFKYGLKENELIYLCRK